MPDRPCDGREPDRPSAPLSDRALRELAEDGAWLERFATSLAVDPAAAADAAQSAWIRGWRARAAGRPANRSWLRTAVLRALQRDARGNARRAVRDQGAARDEAVPPSPSPLERLELQRVVVDAIGRLREPYRTTIVQRFLCGHPVAVIARSCGIPEKTIRTRIARGLDLLREDLERATDGDGSRWLSSLALLAARRGRDAALAHGGLLMGTGTKLAIAAIGLVAIGLVGWRVTATASRDQIELESEDGVARLLDGSTGDLPIEAVEVGTRRRASAERIERPAASVQSDVLRGRALSLDGTAVAGVEVAVRSGTDPGAAQHVAATTDSLGRFEIHAPVEGWLDVVSDGWTVLSHPTVGPFVGASRRPVELLVLPAVDGAGIVVDEDGRALAGVRVRGEVDMKIYLARSDGRDGGRVEERETRTNADGSFELSDLPLIDGSMLVFEHPGYRTRHADVDVIAAGTAVVVLYPVAAEPGHLTGRVVDASGTPVAGAWVTTGGLTVRTGESGAFQVRINELPSAPVATLRAVAERRLPVEREVRLPASEPIELVLDRPSLSIDGTIEGRTRGDVFVWLGGTQSFGVFDDQVDGVTFRMRATLEALMGGRENAASVPLLRTSDRFAFDGLRDVTYDIHAIDVETLDMLERCDVPAGTRGLVLRWPSAREQRPLAGRIVDGEGLGLSGIRVEARIPWSPDAPELDAWPVATTDDEGRFAFPDLNLEQLQLVVRDPSASFQTERVLIDAREDREALEIALLRVVRARFEVENPSFASGYVQVLDRDGTVLSIRIVHAGRDSLTDRAFIEGGRSGVVWFPEHAVLARVVTDADTLEAPLDESSWADGVVTVR
ncbi:MAG: sigma-70 family RNA polymerase sigma factor [Planctomycetota bacterium]